MCGIAGIVDFRRPIEPRVLVQMRDALAHRGPDDAGLWIAPRGGSPAVGLAHRRLAIVDLSPGGRQPMGSPDGRYVLVFNGEIYNYVELARELEAGGWRFRGSSDSEVVLAAYAAWGPRCTERFNGMWALAIWDTHQRRLFASRDRLGKKPLYYVYDGSRLAFASEMKALFRHPAISCQPRTQAVADYARRHGDSAPATMFQGVEQLPAAHHLSLDAAGRLALERYWRIDPQQRLELSSPAEYVEQFGALLEDAVRVRLRADVAVGSSLSGGLDSSLIVGTVARLRGQDGEAGPRRSFSARFASQPTFDEGPYIDAVAAHTGVEAHAVEPTAARLLAELGALHYHQEEPFPSSSLFAQWEVMRLARSRQTLVLLDGQGADELLAGYPPYLGEHLLDLVAAGAWRRAWREYRAFTGRQAQAARGYRGADMRFCALSLGPLLAGGLRRAAARWRMHTTAGFPSADRAPPARSRLAARLHDDLTRRSLPALLRFADRNSMAFGVEVRNPFLDYRLVEFLAQVPDDLKIRDGWSKFLLREWGRGTLPEAVRTRCDKVGFLTPEDEWLRGELRDWAQGILFSRRLRDTPGYPLRRVARAWDAHQSRRRNCRRELWPWLSLHEWLSMIDRGLLSGQGAEASAEPALTPVHAVRSAA